MKPREPHLHEEWARLARMGVPLLISIDDQPKEVEIEYDVSNSWMCMLPQGGTGYGLYIRFTSRRSLVVTGYGLQAPWSMRSFRWLEDPTETTQSHLPFHLYRMPGSSAFSAIERSQVLNHRTGVEGRLRQGIPLEGFLVGIDSENIPVSFQKGPIEVVLSIYDERGISHSERLKVGIDKSSQSFKKSRRSPSGLMEPLPRDAEPERHFFKKTRLDSPDTETCDGEET